MKLLIGSKIANKFSSPDYLAFVHEFPCAILSCGITDVHAHHATYKSHEGSDLDAIPLCEFHHTQYHKIGEEAFCELHGIESGEIQRALIHYYVQSLDRGDRPGVAAEKKKLARGKNLAPLTKKFIPLSERQ